MKWRRKVRLSKMFVAIRIRSSIGLREEIDETLRMLNLKYANNCIVLPETESYKGMLEKVKPVTTYGMISEEMLIALLKKRGRVLGNKRLTEAALKQATGYDSFDKLASDLLSGKIKIKQLTQLKQPFRLTPPSKGFRSTKLHYPRGDLGNRGEKINELLKRMI